VEGAFAGGRFRRGRGILGRRDAFAGDFERGLDLALKVGKALGEFAGGLEELSQLFIGDHKRERY